MELTYSGRTQTGRFSVLCSPGPQDGIPPLSELHFDWDMPQIHDDAMSVASVLTFGRFASGPLSLPRKVSPEVASAIERFLAPSWVSVSPIEFEPRANSVTSGALYVTGRLENWHTVPSITGEPRNESLVVLSSSDFTGYLVSSDGLIMSSNAPVLARMMEKEDSALPYLAIATLFAESFHADTIVLEDDLSAMIGHREFVRAQDLMQSCRLSLLRKSPV